MERKFRKDTKAACFPCSAKATATFGRAHAWTDPGDGIISILQSQGFRYGAIAMISAEVHLYYPHGLCQVICTLIIDGLYASIQLVIQATVALD